MCEQQYFLEYVLGYRSPSNKKADKGTIVHKVLEILAGIKLSQQNKQNEYSDDILGDILVDDYDLSHITERVYDYYTSQFKHHEWSNKDLKDSHLWVNKALSDHNGIFDPRSRNIVQPEQHFDIVIDKPWAEYKYETENGIVEGKLAIKGTIDLITQVNESTLEVIDWKTGKRLDWATGQEKTLEKLYKDPQLKIYHYALSKLYPQYDHIIMSINFINDGGAFSMCFDKSDLSSTENLIRKKFEEIKNCTKPRLSKTWKCTKLCYFGKNTFENNQNILPIIEYRDNQVCSKGNHMTMCEQVKHDIELNGMKNVVDKYTVSGYSVGKYKAPGSTE
jgi:hypothetical protein